MGTAIATASPDATAIEQVLIGGDLSKLTPDQRLVYYKNVCESVGLNPLTKPFDYLTLNSKLVLYAKRDATDQLRKIHGVSLRITARDTIEGVYVVTASASDKHGRVDESTGAVNIASLKGDNLANALMKAETKAKRRVTLSICGLGMLDETEIETIPEAARVPEVIPPANPAPMKAKLAAVTSKVKVVEPKPEEPQAVNPDALKLAGAMIRKELEKSSDQMMVDEVFEHHAATLTAIKNASADLYAWTVGTHKQTENA
jgi:hypothetical protein